MAGPYVGLLHDGKTAISRECQVQFEGDRLKITGLDLSSEFSWSIKDIRLVDESWHEDETFQLRCGLEDDARVELTDRSILPVLKSRNAKLKKDTRTVAPAFAAALTLLVVIAVFWVSLPYVAAAVAKLAPRAWEEKLGETVADSAIGIFTFDNNVKACVGEEGTKALFDLVTKIDQHDGTDYTYRIRVIDSDVVNALAAPAGYIVIFRGILDEFENGNELAAVLAHEIGHVTNQHSLEAIIKAVGVSSIASIVTGDITGSAFGIGIETSLNAQNSQRAEKEADLDGINYLNAAGITSTGLGTFFARLGKKSESEEEPGLGFLASHPSSLKRSAYSQSVSQQLSPAMSDAEWAAIQNICGKTESVDSFEWPEWLLELKDKLPANTSMER